MKFIELLNLPAPSDEVQSLAIELVDSWKPNQFFKNVKELVFPNSNINITSAGQLNNPIIDELIKKQYQQYFNVDIGGTLSFFKNAGIDPCCLPPHTHSVRTIALNYLVKRGGNGVRTTLMRFKNNTEPESKFGGYFTYDDVIIENAIICNQPNWYAFESRLPHSVENIESTRIILAITFNPDTKLDIFTRHRNLKYNVLC
jgi:hypothetical protein